MLMSGKREAKLVYNSSSYRQIAPGDYVVCAATGKPISLEDLRYWNAERQEPYIDAIAATQRTRDVFGT